ncbi:MAG: cytochrome c biogenesis protein CcsA [Bacteroidetes bacterium]|nr:cytochrome c biogenesis protein CcsA [Bacteroidota bacterium]
MNALLSFLDLGSAVLYAAVAVLAFFENGVASRKNYLFPVLATVLLFQIVAFGGRWYAAGYIPAVAWQHAILFSTLLTMSFLFFAVVRNTHWRVILPTAALYSSFLCLWAGLSPANLAALPLSLRSGWLYVHASSAALGQAAFLTAASASSMQLLGMGGKRFSAKVSVTEELSIRAMIASVLFWGGMIIAGALWADDAWGRYWGWDPIEIWSLLIWLLAALHLHAYFAWKSLHGAVLASSAIVLMLLARFALWLIALFHQTIHWYGR